MTALPRLFVLLRRHPSAALLAAQLLGVLLYPWLEQSPGAQVLMTVFGLLVLGLALRMVRRSPAATQLALALASARDLLKPRRWRRPPRRPHKIKSSLRSAGAGCDGVAAGV